MNRGDAVRMLSWIGSFGNAHARGKVRLRCSWNNFRPASCGLNIGIYIYLNQYHSCKYISYLQVEAMTKYWFRPVLPRPAMCQNNNTSWQGRRQAMATPILITRKYSSSIGMYLLLGQVCESGCRLPPKFERQLDCQVCASCDQGTTKLKGIWTEVQG